MRLLAPGDGKLDLLLVGVVQQFKQTRDSDMSKCVQMDKWKIDMGFPLYEKKVVARLCEL